MLPAIRTNRNRSMNLLGNRFSSGLDRMFDDFLSPAYESWDWSSLTPTADFYETDDGFVLEMELAGFSREDVDITVDNGMLTVSGQRNAPETAEGVTYHLRERTAERFSRSFALPSSVDADDVTARLHDGLLHVSLPKVAEAKPRRIEVRTN